MISSFSDILPGYSGGPLISLNDDNTVFGINKGMKAAQSQADREATSAVEIREKFPQIFSSEK